MLRAIGSGGGAIALIAATAMAANAQTVSIATTPSGTYTNSAGAAIAKVVTEHSKVRAVIQAQAQQGHVPVAAGTADFGMSNPFDLTFFVTGTGDYAGQKPNKNIAMIGSLIPYRVAIHVRADSKYKTLADLKGSRMSSGFNAQKTIKRIIEAHLANANLTYKDVQEVLTPNIFRSSQDFGSGKVDSLYFAVGSAAVKQAAASVGGVRVLQIDTSPAALERTQEFMPGSYVVEVKPSPRIEGLSEPTKLIAFDMTFFCQPSTKEDVVYQVTKALHQNKKALASTFGAFNLFDPKEMAKPVKSVPFHPGAVRYYKEAGLMK